MAYSDESYAAIAFRRCRLDGFACIHCCYRVCDNFLYINKEDRRNHSKLDRGNDRANIANAHDDSFRRSKGDLSPRTANGGDLGAVVFIA